MVSILGVYSSGRTSSESETGFRGYETERNPDFESVLRYGKKFYASVHELYPQ